MIMNKPEAGDLFTAIDLFPVCGSLVIVEKGYAFKKRLKLPYTEPGILQLVYHTVNAVLTANMRGRNYLKSWSKAHGTWTKTCTHAYTFMTCAGTHWPMCYRPQHTQTLQYRSAAKFENYV